MSLFEILFLNLFIWVFIIDIAQANKGIIHPLVKAIFKIPQKSQLALPLVDCSLCVVFWTGLIILLCSGFSVSGLFIVCVTAFLSKPVSLVYHLADDLITKIISEIYDIFKL